MAPLVSDTVPEAEMERWRARAGWRIIAHEPESFSFSPVQRQMVRESLRTHTIAVPQ